MKKRIFSALVALTMVLSFMPSAFAALTYYTVGTQVNTDAYALTNAYECAKLYTYYDDTDADGELDTVVGLNVNLTEKNLGVAPASTHYAVYENMDFGDTSPKAVTLYACAWANNKQLQVVAMDNGAEVVLATVDIPNTGKYTTYDPITVNLENEITGVHEVRIKWITGASINLNSFKFLKETNNPYNEVNFIDFDSKHAQGSVNEAEGHLKIETSTYWARYNAYEFGEKGPGSLEVSYSTNAENIFEIRKGSDTGDLLATITLPNNKTWAKSPVIVDIPNEGFRDLMDICFVQTKTANHNLYSFRFIPLPNANDEQVIRTGAYDSQNYQMDFSNGGYNKVVFEGLAVDAESAVAPQVKILSKDGEVLDTIAIVDGTNDYYIEGTSALTDVSTITFENTAVTFTGFKFDSEFDAFAGKDKVKIAYIGSSESYDAVYAAAKEKFSILDRNVICDFTDLKDITTELSLIETEYALKNAGYDMIFVDAANEADSIVDALIGTNTYVMIIGEGKVDEKYAVVETALDTIAADLKLETAYKAASAPAYDNPYKEIIALTDYDEGTTMKVNSDGNALNGTGAKAVFKDVDFSQGIMKANVKVGLGKGYTGRFALYLDSITAENKLGEWDVNAQGWSSWQDHEVNVDKQIYGVHDVWVEWISGNGNLYSVLFTPVTAESTDDLLIPDASVTGTILDGELYVTAEENATFNVAFGDTANSYTAYANVAASEAGTLSIAYGEDTLTIPYEAGTEFVKVYSSNIIENVSGTGRVTVSSTTPCAVKSIKLLEAIDVDADGVILNVDNYADSNLPAYGITTKFGNFATGEEYVEWKNVDFGDTAAVRTVTFEYGTTAAYQNTVMTLRLDSIDGPIIAQATAKYVDGINWEVKKPITVPVTGDATGVHSVFLTVEKGEYTNAAIGESGNMTLAANIFSIDFNTSEEEYLVNYDVMYYYNNSTATYENQATDATLTFVGDSAVSSIIFAEAVYSGEKLVDVELSKHTVVADELNAIPLSVKYADLDAGEYTVKGFVWNGETFEPLTDAALSFGTITVEADA